MVCTSTVQDTVSCPYDSNRYCGTLYTRSSKKQTAYTATHTDKISSLPNEQHLLQNEYHTATDCSHIVRSTIRTSNRDISCVIHPYLNLKFLLFVSIFYLRQTVSFLLSIVLDNGVSSLLAAFLPPHRLWQRE